MGREDIINELEVVHFEIDDFSGLWTEHAIVVYIHERKRKIEEMNEKMMKLKAKTKALRAKSAFSSALTVKDLISHVEKNYLDL